MSPPPALPSTTDVVIIGAGPAGLACSACLSRAAVPHLLLERAPVIAPAWRSHYDRLHLHTSRGYSGLPFRPMPRGYPRYPSRDQVVAYLDEYRDALGLSPRCDVEVRRVERAGEESAQVWDVDTTRGRVRCRHVVVATGFNGRPHRPAWPGLESFPGPMLHSSEYRDGRPHAGRRALVVGFGNSGGEIALDLLEHGARPSIAVRGPVNIIPRDLLGLPILAIAAPLSRLPPRLADALTWPLLKLHYPSYRRLGLRKAERGPFRQIADDRRIPVLDIGTARAIRRGEIEVVPGVDRIDGRSVIFTGGSSAEYDAIVLATGFRPAVPAGLKPGDGASSDGRPTVHYCGFLVSPRGMLREIGEEAERIAAAIARSLDRGATEAGR